MVPYLVILLTITDKLITIIMSFSNAAIFHPECNSFILLNEILCKNYHHYFQKRFRLINVIPYIQDDYNTRLQKNNTEYTSDNNIHMLLSPLFHYLLHIKDTELWMQRKRIRDPVSHVPLQFNIIII